MYKVLLADDEALIREAISTNMNWEELGYQLAAVCKHGKATMEYLEDNQVDLIITDICMPFVDGIDLAKHVYECYPDTRVIILSGYSEFEYAKNAMKYGVLEYILKPVTVSELTEILIRIKEVLNKERIQKDSIKKLTGAYIKNLPILRTRYLNQLITEVGKGNNDEAIQEKLRELNIHIQGSRFHVTVMTVEKEEQLLNAISDAKKDLPSFIIFNIMNEILESEENVQVFQDINNNTVILAGVENEQQHRKWLTDVFEECKRLVEEFFGLGVTMGLGYLVPCLSKAARSYDGADSVLEYRFLYGGNKVLDICDFVGSSIGDYVDIEPYIKDLVLGMKINSQSSILKSLEMIISVFRKTRLSKNKVYLYIQKIIVSINALLEHANLTEEGIGQIQDEIIQMIDSEKTLDQVERSLTNYCMKISGLLAEQRESFGEKQAILAIDYIEKNYDKPDITLQSICSHLCISPSYFSSIFKQYTSETFIESLIAYRMKKAMELLTNTSLKVYEIAEQVGYQDSHYFTVTFKKYTGKTPKEFSRESRNLK